MIIWEYQVKPAHAAEFEEIYSADGPWARLFQKNAGFLGTQLLREHGNMAHYITIDRWESLHDYEAFQAQWKTEYEALDSECEGLTEQETFLGKWETIPRETR